MSNIVEITYFRIKPEHEEAFSASVAEFMSLMSGGADFVSLQMGPVEGKPRHYISEVTRNTVEAHDVWRASDRARELQLRFGPMIAEAKQSIARILIGGPACRALGFTVPTMGDIAK
jgi:hypothetical protein